MNATETVEFGRLTTRQRELGFELADNTRALAEARDGLKDLQNQVSAGVPGARDVLTARKTRIGALEAEAARLDGEKLRIVNQVAGLSGQDARAASLAREFDLSGSQRDEVEAVLRDGKGIEAARALASNLKRDNTMAARGASGYGFNSFGDNGPGVAW